MRITFEDGAWWDIKDWLTRRDRLAMREASQHSALALMEQFSKAGFDMESLQKTQQQMPENAKKTLDVEGLPEEENAMLITASTGWSWDEPISADAILDKPEQYTDIILEAMRNRYEKRNGSEEGKDNSDRHFGSQNKQKDSLLNTQSR